MGEEVTSGLNIVMPKPKSRVGRGWVIEKDLLGSPTDENLIHIWTLGKEIFEKYESI